MKDWFSRPPQPAPDERSCAVYELLLTALFDGQATPDETRRARAHLRECRRCARAFSEWARLRTLFGQMGADLPDAGLLPRILAACRLWMLRRPVSTIDHTVVTMPAVPAGLQDDILRRTVGTGGRQGRRSPMARRMASLVAVPALAALLLLEIHPPHFTPLREALVGASSSGTSAVVPGQDLRREARIAFHAAAPPAALPARTPATSSDEQPVNEGAPPQAETVALDTSPVAAAPADSAPSPTPRASLVAALPSPTATTPHPSRPAHTGGAQFAAGVPKLSPVRSVDASTTPATPAVDVDSLASDVSSISDSRPEDVRNVVDGYRESLTTADSDDNKNDD